MNETPFPRESIFSDGIEPIPSEVPALDRRAVARLDKLLRDATTLQTQRNVMLAREAALSTNVGMAKGRISLKGEMEEALEALQIMAHERSVGAFERMLTAIAHDVQPETMTSIRLDLSSSANMPALDIFAEVAGKPERITSGALSNVVSTGLRFITLARSGRARFMLLDEADCFVEGGDVQRFFEVVDQLSRDAGIQTVLITHHDVSAFEDRFRVYKIAEVDSNDAYPRRLPELVSPGTMEPTALQDRHFSYVEAHNFESYTRARIELSPGVTAITGKNGRGKSSWARMFRGAFLGESSDDYIRHDTPGASINIGFSDGRVLSHNRKAKGTPKGEFILHTAESYAFAASNPTTWRRDDSAPKPLHHTETARLPEWVQKETGVADIDGINVALWPQLTPLFMLDQPPSKRASLLSIGRESGHLFAMNEVYKSDLRFDTVTARDGEKEIGAIRTSTEATQDIDSIVSDIEQYKSTLEALMIEAEQLIVGDKLLGEIATTQSELAHLHEWLAIAQTAMPEPAVERTEGIAVWLERVQAAQEAILLQCDFAAPAPPALLDDSQIQQFLDQMQKAMQDAALAGQLPVMPITPEVLNTEIGSTLLANIMQAQFDSTLPHLTAPPIPEVLDIEFGRALLADMAQAQIDSSLVHLDAPQAPLITPTRDGDDLLQSMSAALAESRIPKQQMPVIPEITATGDLSALLDELARTQTIINSCNAMADALAAESKSVDHAIERATKVLGEQWDMPHDRITRLAEQVTQTTLNDAIDAPRRVVCHLDALEKQLANVAKEGYAHGLTEGVGRTLSSRPAVTLAHESRKLAA